MCVSGNGVSSSIYISLCFSSFLPFFPFGFGLLLFDWRPSLSTLSLPHGHSMRSNSIFSVPLDRLWETSTRQTSIVEKWTTTWGEPRIAAGSKLGQGVLPPRKQQQKAVRQSALHRTADADRSLPFSFDLQIVDVVLLLLFSFPSVLFFFFTFDFLFSTSSDIKKRSH